MSKDIGKKGKRSFMNSVATVTIMCSVAWQSITPKMKACVLKASSISAV
jgi:hypothetical protein